MAGHDIQDYTLESLRRVIGVVPQVGYGLLTFGFIMMIMKAMVMMATLADDDKGNNGDNVALLRIITSGNDGHGNDD